MPTRVFSEEEKENLKTQMLEAGFPLLVQYGMTHIDFKDHKSSRDRGRDVL